MYEEAGTASAYAAYLDMYPGAITQIDRITERGLAYSPQVLVDLCAGTGAVTQRALTGLPNIHKVYLVDSSAAMLQQAGKLIVDPVPNSYWDLVTT